MSVAHYAKVLGTAYCIANLAACAIVKETYMQDGSKGYSISCDGAAVGMNVCFKKAGELCGASGYDLITREGQIIPFGVGSASVQGTQTQIQGQLCNLRCFQHKKHNGQMSTPIRQLIRAAYQGIRPPVEPLV